MDKNCFFLLLLIHIIADFYLQTKDIAEKKNHSSKSLIKHVLIYFGCGIFLAILVPASKTILAIALSTTSHGIIDWIKKLVLSKIQKEDALKKNIDTFVFLADQALHIFVIFMISCIFVTWGGEIKLVKIMATACRNLNLNIGLYAKWGLSALIVCKPINIALKKITGKYNPRKDDNSTKIKAGGFIGSIERILILIFFILGQYTSVGLILTAKSIVRYNEIATDKDFADYYIIGTLTSLLSGILVYYLILA